jgi:hypothetical protein
MPGAYSVPIVLAQRSYSSPAVSASGHGAPVLAWTGTDRSVNLLTVTGNRSNPPIRLEEARSWLAPAVCSHRGNLAVAWTGTDMHLNLGFLSTAGR